MRLDIEDPPAREGPSEMALIGIARRGARLRMLGVVVGTITLVSIASHILSASIGLDEGFDYRRIGPMSGPQALCVGSSVLQYSMNWREVSRLLGQGIEHTNVAGSTPEIWDIFQRQATNISTTIVGMSPYDLNEYRFSTGHAFVVPLSQTIRDLRDSGATWQSSHRVLSQYPMEYVRRLFPTAGASDKVLVGVRRLARQAFKLSTASEDEARVLTLPRGPVLDFGQDEQRLSDMPRDRVLRRLSLLRAENRGMHAFDGPKQFVLKRILARANSMGRVILVILPVSSDYRQEFLTPAVVDEFEQAIKEAQEEVPNAIVVRLDHVSDLQSDDYFTDFVHMNSAGRAIATKVLAAALETQPVQERAE